MKNSGIETFTHTKLTGAELFINFIQKKRKEGEAKIKSILTDEQYKKYQDMRKKENADRKKRTK